jgi:hypothetical protein
LKHFDVYVFIRYCFLPREMKIAENVTLSPFGGLQPLGEMETIWRFCEDVLGQPSPPDTDLPLIGRREADRSPVIVAQIKGITASAAPEAVAISEPIARRILDVVAFHQLQRGQVCAVLTISSDDEIPKLEVYFVIPHIRKIWNLMPEDEARFLGNIWEKAQHDASLRLFLSLYSEATGEANRSFRIYKLWTLVETMAAQYPGNKKEKVRSLYRHFKISTAPAFGDQDLLDFVYAWRNLVAHEGDLSAETLSKRHAWCRPFVEKSDGCVETFHHHAHTLIARYAAQISE